jgi:hypothetical protein
VRILSRFGNFKESDFVRKFQGNKRRLKSDWNFKEEIRNSWSRVCRWLRLFVGWSFWPRFSKVKHYQSSESTFLVPNHFIYPFMDSRIWSFVSSCSSQFCTKIQFFTNLLAMVLSEQDYLIMVRIYLEITLAIQLTIHFEAEFNSVNEMDKQF